MGSTILGMMGSPHREHRNLVANAFKERSLQRWEPEFIAPVCHQLIDEVIEDGRADLVRALTFEFPVRVIVNILGLPADDLEMFKRLSMQLIGIAGDMETGFNASLALKEYFQVQIDARRSKPTDDVINDLVTAEVDGEKLTDEAIVSFLRLLLPAGVETTYRSSGNLLYLLLTHPDQLAAVRQDRSLVPQAIEEGLRRETPLTNVARWTTTDVELGGKTIAQRGHGRRVHGIGQPRRDPMGRCRVLRHLPTPGPPYLLRCRSPRVPGHAPGPVGDPGCTQRRARPAGGRDPRSG